MAKWKASVDHGRAGLGATLLVQDGAGVEGGRRGSVIKVNCYPRFVTISLEIHCLLRSARVLTKAAKDGSPPSPS